MNKKIIIVSVLLIAAVLLFASCNKDKDSKTDNKTEKNTEISTEKNGDMYVTNKNGEHIPVTTSADGSIELIDDLITKTAEQVSKEKEEIKKNSSTAADKKTTTKSNKETTTKKAGSVSVGDENPIFNEDNAAVIDW